MFNVENPSEYNTFGVQLSVTRGQHQLAQLVVTLFSA